VILEVIGNAFLVNHLESYHFPHIILISMQQENSELVIILPDTEAIPALPMSLAVKLRLSRMMGIKGGAAKVERKQVKKEIHERWNARMCGCPNCHTFRVVALCSESTGRVNFSFGSTLSTIPET
jgi:hypothetical protein